MNQDAQATPAARTLHIEFAVEMDSVRLTAYDGGQLAGAELVSKAELFGHGLRLYVGLESRSISEAGGGRLSEALGDIVLAPFASSIETAAEVVFVVPKELLEIPLDLLHYHGIPLFLQLPVSYNIDSPVHSRSDGGFLGSALVISDISADPQRACKIVAGYIEKPIYLDVSESSIPYLRQQSTFDLLLLSVHGEIVSGVKEHVRFGSERVSPDDFAAIKPKLAYFDSCCLGVGSLYLDAFKAMGTQYFVAPILRNEAGDSSTETMQTFFEHLRRGERPESALFFTRKRLWDHYRDDSYSRRMWRASPFRVYRLN